LPLSAGRAVCRSASRDFVVFLERVERPKLRLSEQGTSEFRNFSAMSGIEKQKASAGSGGEAPGRQEFPQ